MKRIGSSTILKVFVLFGAVGAPVGMLSAQDLQSSRQDQDYAAHFRVFTGEGQPATFQDLVEAMAEAEAVLVGEVHTDPVGHWIEAKLVREGLDLVGAGRETGALRSLALSLEMFERDVQGIVDEYLHDLITEAQFKASARPWDYYDEDYRPMVEMAKEAGIPVLAANAPRRYVNRVSRLGPQALNDLSLSARSFLPPLPFPQPSDAYRAEWTALMTGMTMESQCPVPEGEGRDEAREEPEAEEPHAPPAGMPTHEASFMENGLQAQTLWDASMAHTITFFLDSHPGSLVLHMVGGFHVQNFTGIPEKVQFYRPGTRTLVIHMDLADDFSTFDLEEHTGRGDFVILTDQSLDLDYQRNCVEEGAGPR